MINLDRSDHPHVTRVVYSVFEQLHKAGVRRLYIGSEGEAGDRRSLQPRLEVSGFPRKEGEGRGRPLQFLR